MQKSQILKGFRDFLPKEAKKRQYVIDTLRSVFELYGFEPLETPALEYAEVLLGKYGEEADKLLYTFIDRGGRKVGMRYDQTVPLARVVTQYTNALPIPFKRYQIQPVWRAENTQKGRFREFLQCDIDIVGTASNAADAEIIAVVAQSIEKLGFADYKILINDRKIFSDLPSQAITIIDKLKKIGEEKVKKELIQIGFDTNSLDRIKNTPLPQSLKTIMEIAKNMGVSTDKIVYERTLARGLDYYTDMIFEVEIPGYTAGSVVGGGRYDNLVGMFANNKLPAVGVAFGFDRIIGAMDQLQLFPKDLITTKVLVTVFSPDLSEKSLEISSQLRGAPDVSPLRLSNINTELWLDSNTKMEKQLKYADQKGIPYVVIIGPEEKEKNVITLRNMKTREQSTVTFDELLNKVR